MNKDSFLFLQHILKSIEFIEEFTIGITKEQFCDTRKTWNAVVFNLQVIGEAAKNIPAAFKEKHPEIPWSEMVRTRDKLIHGYFGIDFDITWDVIKNDLPLLKEKIKVILLEQDVL